MTSIRLGDRSRGLGGAHRAGRWALRLALMLTPPVASTGLACLPAVAASATTAAATKPAPAVSSNTWQGVWEGRLAGQPIVVALYRNEQGRWTGRYFYERFGRDLGLWGPTVQAGHASDDTLGALILQECAPDEGIGDMPCERPNGQWSLTRAGGTAKGQWQATAMGKDTPRRPPPAAVTLSRVADYTPTAEALADPYEQRRLKGIRAQRTAGAHLGPVAWDTLLDARSRVAAPQFTRGASAAVLQRINDHFRSQWQERIGQALTALDHDDQVDVVFANRRWLATTYSVGFYYAGAAHPSNGFRATTFDLATGQPVDWSRWFRFTTAGGDALDLTRRDLLAAQALKAFAAQVADITPGMVTANADQEHCARQVLAHYACQAGRCSGGDLAGGRMPEYWQVWPTAQGLAVAPDVYAEIDRGCRGQPVILPWAQVRSSLLRPQPLP